MSRAGDRLAELGYVLPAPAQPAGRYRGVVVDGGLAWVSGHTGRNADRRALRGTIGADVDLATARHEAVGALLNVMAALDAEVGLDRVARPVLLRGYVRAEAEWGDHPQVIDAASDLLAALFGGGGECARVAIGVASLPGGASVEIEGVFRLHDAAR